MAKFKVGDRARVAALHPEGKSYGLIAIGDEVTVTKYGTTGASGAHWSLQVTTDDGIRFGCEEWQLEPLTPDLGSWEEIERLTKWKPQGVTA